MAEAVVEFSVLGKPIGKARPRLGQGGRVFTPRETVLAEQTIRDAWINSGSVRLDDGPVSVSVILGVERPRGHFKRDGALSAEGERNPQPHRQKPDVDNAAKLVCDALNSRAWRDDVQIVSMQITRVWTDAAYTYVRAHEITETQA